MYPVHGSRVVVPHALDSDNSLLLRQEVGGRGRVGQPKEDRDSNNVGESTWKTTPINKRRRRPSAWKRTEKQVDDLQ